MPQFDWLCDVCGCVMSPTSDIYWVELGFINNYKEPQLWLVLLRYSADVVSAFPWVVTKLVLEHYMLKSILAQNTPCTLHLTALHRTYDRKLRCSAVMFWPKYTVKCGAKNGPKPHRTTPQTSLIVIIKYHLKLINQLK